MLNNSRPNQTLDKPVTSVADLKEWNFDGSSTNQAYVDPFIPAYCVAPQSR